MYIYENHLNGGIYLTPHELDNDALYCGECGESDWFIGQADSYIDAIELIGIDKINVYGPEGGYDKEFLHEELSEGFDVPAYEEFNAYLLNRRDSMIEELRARYEILQNKENKTEDEIFEEDSLAQAIEFWEECRKRYGDRG